MKVFLGMVYDKQEAMFVHSHVSMSPNDIFHVNIWENIVTPEGAIISEKPICVGEFRKWHHLVEQLDPERYDCISHFKEVSDTDLLFFLSN